MPSSTIYAVLLALVIGVGCGKKEAPTPKEKPLSQDDKEVAEWFRKAAEQGNPRTSNPLGVKYRDAVGVSQDDKETAEWLRKFAEQGYAEAQASLGALYDKGQGVPEDAAIAYAWYNIAAANGHAIAKKNIGLIAKQMTKEQIAKAQELSKKLLKKIEANLKAKKD